ncbi:MAG TPA: hypothetical protein PLI31_05100 [Methanoregulaceae archaeon]|nr:hypothetical protein [Methanoregulaceae archaeon]
MNPFPLRDGIYQQFKRTVPDEFLRTASRETISYSIDEIRRDFRPWLAFSATQRACLGHHRIGHRPIEAIQQYLYREYLYRKYLYREENLRARGVPESVSIIRMA